MKRKDAKPRSRGGRRKTGVREKAFGEIASRFGDVAKALGLVMADDLRKALQDQRKPGPSDPPEGRDGQESGRPGSRKKIGDILVEKGKITEEDLRHILKQQRELEEAKLKSSGEVKGFLTARKRELADGRDAAREVGSGKGPDDAARKVGSDKGPDDAARKVGSGKGPDDAARKVGSGKGPDDAAPQDLARTLEELARKVDELERKLVTREKAEEIAAGAALDVLKLYEDQAKRAVESVEDLTRAFEKREFARSVAESLSTGVCRKALQETVGDIVHFEFEQALETKARKVFVSQLGTPRFAEKLKEIAGASEEIDRASQRLAARLDRIESETLPERVEMLFNQKLQDKLGDLSPEMIAEKLDPKVLEKQLMKLSGDAVRDVMTSPELKAVVEESLFHAAMTNVANTPEFKALLDEKFNAMLEYISQDVIPKQVERLGGGDFAAPE